tara:strand:- start:56 stop:1174 length:1119 start_codon:yes stop_codon:yes gene_type:complete
MTSVGKKSFECPDKLITAEKTYASVLNFGSVEATRVVLQPGWKWSECIKPLVGTESCRAGHLGVVHEGTLYIVHDDGTEMALNAGDAYSLAPGHDAWVKGDEDCICYEFNNSGKDYAVWQSELERARQELLDRMQRELEEARKLQLSLLPKSCPEHPTYEVSWYMNTATEVGGDYYDYAIAEDGTLTITLGDATGHGMAAGTLVSVSKSLFRTLFSQDDMTETFSFMSRTLNEMNMNRIYMAMNMIKFKEGRMQITSAGIPPVLFNPAETGHVEEILIPGLPLGCKSPYDYQQKEFVLAPGDTVLMMSDGLPERTNRAGEEMGYDRVRMLFGEVGDQASDDIVKSLVAGGEDWSGGRPQDDDITLIAVKVKT